MKLTVNNAPSKHVGHVGKATRVYVSHHTAQDMCRGWRQAFESIYQPCFQQFGALRDDITLNDAHLEFKIP